METAKFRLGTPCNGVWRAWPVGRLAGEVDIMATAWEPSGVGKRIRAFRKRRGLTQETVAGLVGRSVSWLRQIEAGSRHVDSLSMIFDLARVLHCEPTELIGRALLLAPGRGGRVPESVPAIRAAIMAPD